MPDDASRRFTDKEVALVLRKASELEESEGAGGGAGLTLGELEQIATEVGIDPDRVRRAVQEMDTRSDAGVLSSAPRVHQSVRAVQGKLDTDATAELIRHVDGSSDQVGVVTQALGATQWTARDRLRTTQISIRPSEGETQIRVVERASSRLWRLTHLAPTGFGVALVAGTVGAMGPSSGMVASLMAVGGLAGAAVGRFLWGRLSAASRGRVDRLAETLTREAASAAVTQDPPDTED